MNIKLLIAFLSLVTVDFSTISSSNFTKIKVQEKIVTDDTLVFQLYNDFITVDEEFSIDVFSPNFDDILGFQFALEMVELEFMSVTPKNINLNTNYYNWKSDIQTLLVSFSDSDVHAVNPEEKLFTINVKAKKSGYLKDMLAIREDILTSEAIYLSFDNTSIVLSFDFLERKSTNTKDLDLSTVIKVYPNQLQEGQSSIKVEGMNILEASLYKFNGSYLQKCNVVGSSTIGVGQQVPGMYILKIYDGFKYHNELITII